MYSAACNIAPAWFVVRLLRVFSTFGNDFVQICSPSDLLIPASASCKLFDRKFAFDHLDIEPELADAKFGRRNLFRHLVVRAVDILRRRRVVHLQRIHYAR